MHQQRLIHTVKHRREVLQITQDLLSDLSGVNLRTIKQFETGKGNPTLNTISKIADVLGLEIRLQVKTPNSIK